MIQIISVDFGMPHFKFVVARGRLELKIGISDIITNPSSYSFSNRRIFHNLEYLALELHNIILFKTLINEFTGKFGRPRDSASVADALVVFIIKCDE